jgi:hypothetical protein
VWGPSPDYDLISLTSPSVLSAGRWIGGGPGGGVTSVVGPILRPTGGVWPFAQGGSQGGNATGLLMVDNSASSVSLIVKLEECKAGFLEVLPGERKYGLEIDGALPPAWTTPPQLTGDWYKLQSRLLPVRQRLRIDAQGNPHRSWPVPWLVGLVTWPTLPRECSYGDVSCSFTVAGKPPYDLLGGRKKEPEWSNSHRDWKWPDLFPGDPAGREQACITGAWPQP